MKISITQFAELAKDTNSSELPLGARSIGNQVLTAVGTTTASVEGCRFVRIATDTAVMADLYGASLLLPAGSVEFFPLGEAKTITFTAA